MTEVYEIGKIYGWNGGDCPVHPETIVKIWLREGGLRECPGKNLVWQNYGTYGDIIAFQVVKAYVEPKVIWVNEYDGLSGHAAYDTEEKAKKFAQTTAIRIAVKYQEVKE